jgi:L-alanine-DL-glutamate epimerase-like enolase superfamily enzyme
VKLTFLPYRLKFKEPFGTAHGMRDGTDSVFVQLEKDGHVGHGEATMPPYVKEDQNSVMEVLTVYDGSIETDQIFQLSEVQWLATRAALTTAYYDLISKLKKIPIGELLELDKVAGTTDRRSVITLGITEQSGLASKLNELPLLNSLKIKLDGLRDQQVLEFVLANDARPLLLDANQAWNSVEHALRMIDLVGADRLIGVEQPFPIDRPDLQRELTGRSAALTFADESIQTTQDLERCKGMFGGINVKLMKCGGLDKAAAMIKRARELGLNVMLGSMSESSLGCGAMLHLKEYADVVDLDGPWLIGNDPFSGIELRDGEPSFVRSGGLGIGVTSRG